MTDGQIHLLAQALDDVLAGGEFGLIIAILLIILLVIVILEVSGHSVVVK